MAHRLTGFCTWSGCETPARPGCLCDMHERRRRSGYAMNAEKAEKVPPFEKVILVANELADAEGDRDYSRAKAKLSRAVDSWKAAEGYVMLAPKELRQRLEELARSILGWRPPKARKPRHDEPARLPLFDAICRHCANDGGQERCPVVAGLCWRRAQQGSPPHA